MVILRNRETDKITYEGDTIYELRDPVEIPEHETDTQYRAKTGEMLREVCQAVYGEARWWWVIADLNGIVNPFDPVRPDKVLRMPSLTRLQDYVT